MKHHWNFKHQCFLITNSFSCLSSRLIGSLLGHAHASLVHSLDTLAPVWFTARLRLHLIGRLLTR